jgi:hypothetical protein
LATMLMLLSTSTLFSGSYSHRKNYCSSWESKEGQFY